MENFIILNLDGQGWQTEGLKKRLIQKGNSPTDIKIMNITPELINSTIESKETNKEMQDTFSNVDNKTKIYVIGHSYPKAAYLGNVHYTHLADFFGLVLSGSQKLDKASPNPHQEINLIACNAGVGDDARTDLQDKDRLRSFASRFHEYIGKQHQIKPTVVARKSVVMLHMKADEVGKKTASLPAYGLITQVYHLKYTKSLILERKPIFFDQN